MVKISQNSRVDTLRIKCEIKTTVLYQHLQEITIVQAYI